MKNDIEYVPSDELVQIQEALMPKAVHAATWERQGRFFDPSMQIICTKWHDVNALRLTLQEVGRKAVAFAIGEVIISPMIEIEFADNEAAGTAHRLYTKHRRAVARDANAAKKGAGR